MVDESQTPAKMSQNPAHPINDYNQEPMRQNSSSLLLLWLICCGLNNQWLPPAWNLKLKTGLLTYRMMQLLPTDCSLKLWPGLLCNFYLGRVTHLTTPKSAPKAYGLFSPSQILLTVWCILYLVYIYACSSTNGF